MRAVAKRRLAAWCVPFGLLACGGEMNLQVSEPVSLEIVGGDGQVQAPGVELFAPLSVRLVGGDGLPARVSGVRIRWLVTAGAGSVLVDSDTTTEQGIATARWTLGGSTGVHRLEALPAGLPGVEFTAESRDPGPIVFVSGRSGILGNEFEGFPGDLYAMEEDGSGVMRLSSPELGVRYLTGPRWSPDRQTILFASASGRPAGGVPGLLRAGIHRLDLRTLTERQVPPNSLPAAVAFYVAPAWSPDGSHIVAHVDTAVGMQNIPVNIKPGQLHIMSQMGFAAEPVPTPLAWAHHADWSPVGDRLVFVCRAGAGRDICAMDRDGGNLAVLAGHASDEDAPAWSPDGSQILYVRDRENGGGVWIMDANGANQGQVLAGVASAPEWAPDGTRFLVVLDSADRRDIHVVELATGQRTNLTDAPFVDRDPSWRR